MSALGYVDQPHHPDYLTREQAEARRAEHGCPHCRNQPLVALITVAEYDAMVAELERRRTKTRCAWCDAHASGTALTGADERYPSCGEGHGRAFVPSGAAVDRS